MDETEEDPARAQAQPDRFCRAYGAASVRSDQARFWRDSLPDFDPDEDEDASPIVLE